MLAQPIHHVEAVTVGQADIEDEQMRLEGETQFECPIERVGLLHRDAVARENAGDH